MNRAHLAYVPSTRYGYVYYGGVGDLWETVLAPGDVNRPDFGVTVTVGGYQWPAVDLVDDVRIGVYYDGP